MNLKKGAYELILEGRRPGAVAQLTGDRDASPLHGEAEFYMTPLGVVLCAELSGLPRERRSEVFGLQIGDEITPIYAKSGSAWCALMTRHKTVSDVLGKAVTVLAGRFNAIGSGTICSTTDAVSL